MSLETRREPKLQRQPRTRFVIPRPLTYRFTKMNERTENVYENKGSSQKVKELRS